MTQIANDVRSIGRAIGRNMQRSIGCPNCQCVRAPAASKMCPRAVGWRQHKKVSANSVAVQHFGAVQHLEEGGGGADEARD